MSYDISDGDGDELDPYEGEQRASTSDAVLIDIDGEDHWLPRSRVTVEKQGGKFSSEVRVWIPRWLARSRGLT